MVPGTFCPVRATREFWFDLGVAHRLVARVPTAKFKSRRHLGVEFRWQFCGGRNFQETAGFKLLTTLRMVVQTTNPSDAQLAPVHRRGLLFCGAIGGALLSGIQGDHQITSGLKFAAVARRKGFPFALSSRRGVCACVRTRVSYWRQECNRQEPSAVGAKQHSPARSRTGAPDSRRFCANWGGAAECWVSRKLLRVP